MNIMKIIALIQQTIAEGGNSEIVQDIKRIAIHTINEDYNCGHDRAEITVMNLLTALSNYAKEKEII